MSRTSFNVGPATSDYLASMPAPDPADHPRFATLSALIEELVAARAQSGAANRERRLIEREIPDEMFYGLGLMGFTTPSGRTVRAEVSPLCSPLSDEGRVRLVAWLDENGHGAVADQLRAPQPTKSRRRSVDATALHKFVRAQLEARRPFPWDVLGVVRTHVARLV